MVHYKIIYFNMRARAETARQILVYSGVPFDDVRVEAEEWTKLKPTTPYGQLPILEVDGKVLCQSAAINRYLARQFGMDGSNDWEAAKIDEVNDGVNDVLEKMLPWFRETDPAKKKELFAKLIEQHLKPHFAHYEKLLTANGTGFFVGSKISWFDLRMAELVNIWQEKVPEAIQAHPKLIEYSKKIQSEPKLKKWIESRPKTEW